jgi:hypothetical protein
MLVEDESLRKMFAFGDEEPETIVEEVITVEPEPEAAVVIDVPAEPPPPAPAEVAMASMVEALVDLQRQLNDLQGREVERVVNRDKNGLIVSITEKRRA